MTGLLGVAAERIVDCRRGIVFAGKLPGDVIGDRKRPAEDDDLPRVEPGDLVQDDLGDLPLGGDVEDRPAAQL